MVCSGWVIYGKRKVVGDGLENLLKKFPMHLANAIMIGWFYFNPLDNAKKTTIFNFLYIRWAGGWSKIVNI
jgi:hypothetical protein